MELLKARKTLLPLLVLAGVCWYTVIVTLFTQVLYEGTYYDRAFTFRHYLAFTAVALNVVLYFYYRPLYKFTVAGMLLLGIWNVICFTPDQLTAGIGMDDSCKLSLQPFSLLFAIAFYVPNRKTVHGFLRKYLFPAPSLQRLAEYQRESIDKFKATFVRKSTESLSLMIQEKKMVPAAVQAAQELLLERKTAKASSLGQQ
ncbi:hypothetical protein [Hymenobacter chitinivorans]|nr:hypothetical protein [Hymenobacter chitinivorans]